MINCGACGFYIQYDHKDDAGKEFGYCVRYPPVPFYNSVRIISFFPEVNPNQCCGEGQLKEEDKLN